MTLSPLSALKASTPPANLPQHRIATETCPLCEQPLPPERLDEMKERIAHRELAQTASITNRVQEQFEREKKQALDQAGREAAALLTREKQEAAVREAKARIEHEAAMEKMKQDAAARENAVRQESASQVEVAMQAKITQAEQAKAEAETKATAAEQRIRSLQETHNVQLVQRLQEQREALEQDKTNAVNAEKSTAFEEKMKLSSKVEELQRAIDKKTAEDLGEGAEVDLFEALKAEFDGDRIERINKGQPGADILHVVIHNARECGKIIYDSKNHSAWRYEFVTKLATDKVAAKAEHAILSTRKFPQDTGQLHTINGVILASPARVVALVQIVRQHLVHTHTLRLSNEARAQKTAALYDFITSERCADLFARIDAHAEDLLELQAKEIKAHQVIWKRQGELARSIQKTGAEMCNEIDMIVGASGTVAQVVNE